MSADASHLQAAIDALTAQVAKTETIEASAVALIHGFAAQVQTAVTAALSADNKVDQANIDAAMKAIASVTDRFTTSSGALSEALTANNPSVIFPTQAPQPQPAQQ